MLKTISNDFGDYSRQVVIKLPNGKIIQCDYELASEISYLNMIGIETVASCSGHGILVPTISVKKEFIDDMKNLGYKIIQLRIDGYNEFLAKHCVEVE